MNPKRIAIVNGGGDCAGMNAVIAAVVKRGISLGYEFIGFEKGWEGMLSPVKYRRLELADIRNISNVGGTILHTTNHGRFGAKVGDGQNTQIPMELLLEAKQNLEELQIDGLIVIGGDGTLSAGLQMLNLGVKMVGVPKTIDNDLMSTDRTFGFSTAVSIVVDAIDKLQTTAHSHDRTFFVECMGRYAGWITLFSGLAGGADAILLPEFPLDAQSFTHFLRFLKHRKQQHKYATIVAVAEGIKLGNKLIEKHEGIAGSEVTLGGASVNLMNAVESAAPGEFEMRNVVLGHIQRGGSPNAEDRILAKKYGVAAIEAYHREEFGNMVCLQGEQMRTVPIAQAVNQLKRVTPTVREYQTAKKLGIFI
jgi:6-phosphofructokinase 1